MSSDRARLPNPSGSVLAVLMAIALTLPAVAAKAQTTDPCVVPKSDEPRPGLYDQVYVQAKEGYTEEEVQDAADLWNNACGNNDGAKFPKLSAQDPPGDNWTVSLHYAELNASGDGHCGSRVGNDLTVYSYTKINNEQVSCGDKSQTTAHELGHWLGLGDVPQPQSSTCDQHIMAWLTQTNGNNRSVQPGECTAVDKNWSTPKECSGGNPPDQGCLPEDVTGHLPGRCERVRELCDPTGPTVWWVLIPETRPVCGFQWVAGPEETYTMERHCFFVTSAVVSSSVAPRGAETTPGPVISLRNPVPGSYVRGVVELDGWLRDDAEGVTGTLGFWLDQQHLYPGNVVYGDLDSAACAGSTDPNCPYVGFSASVDTATLSNGAHTLEIMGAQDVPEYPTPAYGKWTFTVDNGTPSLTITAPSDGETLSGTVQVTASASDTYGVDKVSFLVDDSWQATDRFAPYSYSFDTSKWLDGSHTVRVKAVDRAGNTINKSITVTTRNDFSSPQVQIVQPAMNAFVHGTVTVEAEATDDLGVSYVEFYRGAGELLATDSTAPYQASVDTTGYPDGALSFTARAYDTNGKLGFSLAVPVTVDNTVPGLYVDAPTNYQGVSGTAVRVAGWAIDSSGIVSRTFKIDGTPLTLNGSVQSVNRGSVCTSYPEVGDPDCPYVGWRAYFDSTRYSNGAHTLTVTVLDKAGNAKVFNRTFVIQNPYTATFNPVADATAWQANPTYNNGTAQTLTTGTTSGGSGAYAFLKFQVSGIQGQITSARLKVRTLSNMTELWLYWLVHSNWTESNLTWNNFPGPGGDLDHFYSLYANTWYSFNVSSYVTGNGTYSMGFANTNPTYASLYSRESAYKPVLEITYVP